MPASGWLVMENCRLHKIQDTTGTPNGIHKERSGIPYPTIPFNSPNLGKPSSTPAFDYKSSTTPYAALCTQV